MLDLLGEYELRLDAKGRLSLPSGLKKQLGGELAKGFVVNRDVFQPCLVLYPLVEWEKTQRSLRKLNQFKEKNRVFTRRYLNGATAVEADGSDRLLLPKTLMDHAGISKEVKLVGLMDRIEVWSKAGHARMLSEPVDLHMLSEEVMGNLGNSDDA